jgi:integrase
VAGSVPRGIRKRINSAGQPRYQVRYLVRDPESPSGWVETSSTFATLREARVFKADRDGEAAIGARRFDSRLGRVKLAGIWTQYSASKRPAVSPKTWSGYTQHWELRISPRSGHVPLDEIGRKDVQQFINTLTVGPWAKLATLRLLRSILEMAREDGRIHINPARGVSAGRIPARERHRYLTASEVAALTAACGDHGDVVTILAFTGLRWSELVGLRVGDIDLVARRLYVRRAAPEVEGRIIVGPPKTRSAVRTVPLPPNRHRRTQATNRRPCTWGTSDHITERRLPQIKQLASPRPMVGRLAENTTGASDDSRPTPHLRQPCPGLRRRPSLRPENHGATPHRLSPRTSTATSTQMNSTT